MYPVAEVHCTSVNHCKYPYVCIFQIIFPYGALVCERNTIHLPQRLCQILKFLLGSCWNRVAYFMKEAIHLSTTVLSETFTCFIASFCPTRLYQLRWKRKKCFFFEHTDKWRKTIFYKVRRDFEKKSDWSSSLWVSTFFVFTFPCIIIGSSAAICPIHLTVAVITIHPSSLFWNNQY